MPETHVHKKPKLSDEHHYVCWDIETDALIDDELNHHEISKVNITCASTLDSSSGLHKLWYTKLKDVDDDDLPSAPSCWSTKWAHDENAKDLLVDKKDETLCETYMDVDTCELMLKYMEECVSEGATIVSWNGASFDFRVLSNVFTRNDKHDLARRTCLLCHQHSDVMYAFFAHRGFYVGLEKTSLGMFHKEAVIEYKSMKGSDAVTAWMSGSGNRQREVLRYVLGDTWLLLKVAQQIDKVKTLYWITASGNRSAWLLPRAFSSVCRMSVVSCSQVALPDTSWMRPMHNKQLPSRDKFTKWMLPYIE
jgi:hypothetical protein